MIARKIVPAVGYVRMSSSKQDRSPEQQRDEIEKLAKREGAKIVRWYEDLAISGDATEKRSGFQRMIHDAGKSKDFRLILCWDYARFGRFDSIEAGKWIDPLRKARVKLVTVSEGHVNWDDFTGRVINALYAEGQHQYLTKLSQNVLRGKVKAVEAGFHATGGAPLGYDRIVVVPGTGERVRVKRGDRVVKPVGSHTVLDISEDAAEVDMVRWIFETFTGKHVSLCSMARDLAKRGVRGMKGGIWTAGQLKQVLTNPVYCGDVVWNRKRRGKYYCYTGGQILPGSELSLEDGGRPKPYHKTAESDWIVKRDVVPPIVPRSVWDKAQKRLAGRGRSRQEARTSGYELSGLLFCGNCGRRMCGTTKRRDGHRDHRSYRCDGHARSKGGLCGHNAVSADKLLAFVLRTIQTQILTDERRKAIEARIRQLASNGDKANPAKAKQIEKQVAELDRRITKGTENLLLAESSEIPAARAVLASWREQRAGLAAELDQLRAGPKSKADVDLLVREVRAELEHVAEDVGSDDPAVVRGALGSIIERIELWFDKPDLAKGRYRCHLSRGLLQLKPSFFSGQVLDATT